MIRRVLAIGMALFVTGVAASVADAPASDSATLQLQGVVHARTDITIHPLSEMSVPTGHRPVAAIAAATSVPAGCALSMEVDSTAAGALTVNDRPVALQNGRAQLAHLRPGASDDGILRIAYAGDAQSMVLDIAAR